MALRQIVRIDEAKCNGCGLCITACAEGAIALIDGKARLVSEIYCDGLGACLGHCPEDAISVEQREAAAFDEAATQAYLLNKQARETLDMPMCPGMRATQFQPVATRESVPGIEPSQLAQWPVQLKLVPPSAPYFRNADVLLVADCVPFAMADFHQRYLKNHSIAIGCPKLDDASFYIDKMRQIVSMNALNSLTVIHMEVPCCSGLTHVAREAIKRSGKDLSFKDVTVDVQGNVVNTRVEHGTA